MSANLYRAYELARQGIYVFAVNGKAPFRGTRGHLDATTDLKVIGAMYQRHPDAGVAVALEPSGIVDLAADSPEWLAEFERRGLPGDAPRYQSPGGDGHVHIWMRRPPDCPAVRICKSGEYDLMSAGYAVAPDTETPDGRYTWITPTPNLNGGLPDAPAWVVEMLRARAAEVGAKTSPRSPPRVTADASAGADEPPVDLSEHDRAVWAGERFKARPDGTVDRSASLLHIGRVLFDAGMTRRGVVAELRARDEQLGWRKYSDRADGEAQYHAIVDELERTGRSPRLVGDHTAPELGLDDHPVTDAAPESRCAALERRHRQVVERLRALTDTYDAVLRVAGNAALMPTQRLAAIFTVVEAVTNKHRGKTDERGDVYVHMLSVARRAGLPERTYATATKALADRGIIPKRTVRVQARTPGAPVPLGDYYSETHITIEGESVAEALRPLAAVKPDPERKRPGGWRPRRCPDHPGAAVLGETTYICAECGQLLDRTEARIALKAVEDLNCHSGDSDAGDEHAGLHRQDGEPAAARVELDLKCQIGGPTTSGRGAEMAFQRCAAGCGGPRSHNNSVCLNCRAAGVPGQPLDSDIAAPLPPEMCRGCYHPVAADALLCEECVKDPRVTLCPIVHQGFTAALHHDFAAKLHQ